MGDGAGGFAAPTHFPAGSMPFSVVTGDVDGDGAPDLAVANYGSDDVSVLLNDLANPVTDPPTVAVASGGSCGSDDRSGTVNLLVSDSDSPSASLTLSAVSSNPALLPGSSVVFAGSGANRTLTATALVGKAGTAVLTVTVSDGQASGTAVVTVNVGGKRADTLSGTAGTDILLGQKGNDTLSGLGGIDLLCGGAANDTLTGGLGADRFSGGRGTDVATDLTPAQGDTQDGSIP